MTKILLIGHTPPVFDRSAKIEAANYRTWQFLQPLLEEGHNICLCVRRKPGGNPVVPPQWQEQCSLHQLDFHKTGWKQELQKIHNDFQPDCIVAVNFDACLYATKLKSERPIWMDIYGDYLTIIQAACYRVQSDRGLPTSIGFMKRVLRRGDIFSTCSRVQGHALAGELAMAGRLNRRTFGYDFIRTILPGALPASEISEGLAAPPGISFTRQVGDFVLLWCGGYNAWTDVDTLFAGLEWAMEKDQRIKFLSIGANTYQAPANVYEQFTEKIQNSKYRQRFWMLGWRPWQEVNWFYHQSSAGINIDALHYETIYGTRTRLLEMIASGLPIITSLGCELSYMLRDMDIALAFKIGDWLKLGENILRLSSDPGLREAMSKRALQAARGEFSFSATTQDLLAWVKLPSAAPDNQHLPLNTLPARLAVEGRSAIRHLLWALADLDGSKG